MTYYQSSYEQTRVVRDAVEMVTRLIRRGHLRRVEIAKTIFDIANHEEHDASSLANLAVAALKETDRKTG